MRRLACDATTTASFGTETHKREKAKVVADEDLPPLSAELKERASSGERSWLLKISCINDKNMVAISLRSLSGMFLIKVAEAKRLWGSFDYNAASAVDPHWIGRQVGRGFVLHRI